MLLPLWGRGLYSRLYPELLEDPYTEKLYRQVRHDFSDIEGAMGEYGGLAYLVRARKFDLALLDHLEDHPRAVVVNLGAGLDTTFSRVDNGLIRWFDLDLPDAIAFRQKLILGSERGACLARSAFDQSWFDEIGFMPEDGVFCTSPQKGSIQL